MGVHGCSQEGKEVHGQKKKKKKGRVKNDYSMWNYLHGFTYNCSIGKIQLSFQIKKLERGPAVAFFQSPCFKGAGGFPCSTGRGNGVLYEKEWVINVVNGMGRREGWTDSFGPPYKILPEGPAWWMYLL